MVDEKIDKRKIQEGDWVRVRSGEDVGEGDEYRRHDYFVEGFVYLMPESDEEREVGLYVGCLWLDHRENIVIEHRPKGES